ncbi:hypothetical protein K461DRAFT_127186 [Myriangium duriaei CBS 260.36]|uniref:Uncharacterized protein n=1 Tax=Myriangium duriaei CBS 260.36 TaxID=1168546 RepID=A0A9P4J8N1_9PEZI|nr:hypothetical protein K461DRAFT_127186 [Myriangium duriaei CBS 260.36]
MALDMSRIRDQKVRPVLAFLEEPLDEDLIWEALQMAGDHVPVINGRRPAEGNKGLACVGNTVSRQVVTVTSYRAGRTTGQISQAVQTQLSNSNMAAMLLRHNLVDCINKNPAHVGDVPTSTLSYTTEALIGAAELSGGNDMAERVMLKLGIIT